MRFLEKCAKGSLDRVVQVAVPAMQRCAQGRVRSLTSHAVTNRVEVINRLRCLRQTNLGPDICLTFSTGHLVKGAHLSAPFDREGPPKCPL